MPPTPTWAEGSEYTPSIKMYTATYKHFQIEYLLEATVDEGWVLTDEVPPENIFHDRIGMVRTRTFQPKDISFTAKGTVKTERTTPQNVEVGFIQFLMSTTRVLSYQENRRYKVKIPGCPRRDGGESRENPWYHPVDGKKALSVSKQLEGHFAVSVSDCPRFPVPIEHRPQGQQVRATEALQAFDEVDFRETFATFLVLRLGTEVAWLHRVDWAVTIVGKVNPSQIPANHGARCIGDAPIDAPTKLPDGLVVTTLSGRAAHMNRTIGLK